jgi:FMN phosphatase YigB (HAD superfamily)
LQVPRLTVFALLGAVIASGRPHTDVFSYFRESFDFEAEADRKAGAGLPWWITNDNLYADAIPTLGQLREDGYHLAVMANQPLEAGPFLESLPVDIRATSAEWGVSKPDARFFECVAAEVDCTPARIAYVGDRVDNDVIPARAAGMVAVHLRRGPWGFIQADSPSAGEADIRIDALTELPGALATFRR